MGKLLVIDGLDGTGKATQVGLLNENMKNVKNFYTEFYSTGFPQYGKPSAKLVENYLSGKYGSNPSDVDPELASFFYTADRVESYYDDNEVWGKLYNQDALIISDRYTSSNIIHQGCKFIDASGEMDMAKFGEFVEWLYEKEYKTYKLPKPNVIIYLKTSKEANEKMLRDRGETAISGDIHENDLSYLDKCRKTLDVYQKFIEEKEYEKYKYLNLILPSIKHFFINVTDPETLELRSREDIAKDIWDIVNLPELNLI